MELSYRGKKSAEDIIKSAREYKFDVPERVGLPLLIHSDNFKGLSYLLNSGYEGRIDLVYIDPPFNTQQDFVVSEDRSRSVSAPRDGTVAYSDKFSAEEYLEFIRERIILIHRLLSEQGSLYFHIDTKMGHYCKLIIDEVFGRENFKNDITRIKSNPKNFERKAYGNEKDIILFYAKNSKKNIWNGITEPLTKEERKRLYTKRDRNGYYTTIPLHAPGETKNGETGKQWRGMLPPQGRHWRTNPSEFDKLDEQGLIEWSKTGNPRIKKYAKNHKGKKIQDIWTFKDPQYPEYPTQKNSDLLKRIVLQSSNPESIVIDCFSGGGTTLVAAQETGRSWIGIDNSEEAIRAAEARLTDSEYSELDFT